jgi:hypothetical protein
MDDTKVAEAPVAEQANKASHETTAGGGEIRTLSIDSIETDRDLQARVKALDTPHVENLREAVRKGQKRIGGPPVVFLVTDPPKKEGDKPTKHYIIADGHHWMAAMIQEDKKRMEVEVREGTRSDALRFAVGANSTHGLPRSTADKERAIVLCLKDPVLGTKSNVQISKLCNVSQGLVDRVRTEYEKEHGGGGKREGADGRSRKAKITRKTNPDKAAAKEAREAAVRLAEAKTDDQLSRITKPKKGAVDDIGQEIPEPLLQAFAGRTDVRGMLSVLQNMLARVPILREAGPLAWASKAVESNLRAVIAELGDSQPAVVKDGHKHGFLSTGQYAALSAAEKKALQKVAEEEATDAEGTATAVVAG